MTDLIDSSIHILKLKWMAFLWCNTQIQIKNFLKRNLELKNPLGGLILKSRLVQKHMTLFDHLVLTVGLFKNAIVIVFDNICLRFSKHEFRSWKVK